MERIDTEFNTTNQKNLNNTVNSQLKRNDSTSNGNMINNSYYQEAKNKKKHTQHPTVRMETADHQHRSEWGSAMYPNSNDPILDVWNPHTNFSPETEKVFYFACYDPIAKEIYFLNFLGEDIITNNDENLLHNKKEIYEKLKKEFDLRWKKIKEISELEDEEYLSDKSKKYFRIPLLSKFIENERLELNNFNSSYPLPAEFIKYEKVKLNIHFHKSVLDIEKDPTNQQILKYTITREVGFFYVVDTIVKDSLKQLLKDLKDEKSNIFNLDKYKIFREDLNNTKNKYVIKMKALEEYMYGDYPISTYQTVRKIVREYGTVELYIMKFPYKGREVQPNITHFPPLISYSKDKIRDFTYNVALTLYTEFFVQNKNIENSPIIIKIKPDRNLEKYYFKGKDKRKEKLKKFSLSGEADCPLKIEIVGIKNLFALKNYMDDAEYIKSGSTLPFFKMLKSYDEIKNKKNWFRKKFDKLIWFCKRNDPKNGDNHRDSDDEKEYEIHEKLAKKYEKGKKFRNELNYLQERKKKKDDQNEHNMIGRLGFYNTKYSEELKKRLEFLSKRQENSLLNELETLNTKDYVDNQILKEKINFTLKDYNIDFLPCFLKLEVILIYGSYTIASTKTRYFLIKNDMVLHEEILFDSFLISHLPRETRVCINIIGYNNYQSKTLVLGSAQESLYDENGMFQSGLIPVSVWPLFETDPRIVFSSPFTGRSSKEKANELEKNLCTIYLKFPRFAVPMTYVLKNPHSYREFLKIKHLRNDVNEVKEMTRLFGDSIKHLEKIMTDLNDRDRYFLDLEEKKKKKKDELKIEENNQKPTQPNSVNAKNKIVPRVRNQLVEEEDQQLLKKNFDVWRVLENILPKIKEKISVDPLKPLEELEREEIVFCRDYICTIPSAFEVFLRSIDWLDPIQVYIAKSYIKKWEKLEPEDAICLLDARFPDTSVREYAVSILSEMTDDLVSVYILQLTQALIYEPYIMNPLSNYLISKFLDNPKLIGNSFFWNAKVGYKNPIFKERLSVIIANVLMLSGTVTIKSLDDSININNSLQHLGLQVKNFKNTKSKKDEKNNLIYNLSEILEYLKKKNFPMKEIPISLIDLKENIFLSYLFFKEIDQNKLIEFTFPIHPHFHCAKLNLEKLIVFDSKMVPAAIACHSEDGNLFRIIFKDGDDLRQDVITLQILKVMDKLWLDNDLDLKITSYCAQPTAPKQGYLEFVDSLTIAKIQQQDGVGGALDRELLIKHFKFSNEKGQLDTQMNFIMSLAGFCVATCVLGIADRHPSNVMVKENGIFFHIDYGHFLGNWKFKFGIKRERALFLLTPEMAHVYTKYSKEDLFKDTCVKAFNILRKNANRLINLFIMMTSANLPELSEIQDIDHLKNVLKLDKKSEEDAGNYFIGLISESKNEKFRLLDNMIHNMKHG